MVRPIKLRAMPAPAAVPPLPAMPPARDSTVEVSLACTLTELEVTACVRLVALARTLEVMLLVVNEPLAALLPEPAAPTAID